jgi:lipopolysaccharide transport system permease protein
MATIMKSLWLSEFWSYRELFYFMVWRNVKIRYKQTFLGATWAIIQPFFTMVVFTIFFGKFAKIPTDGIPHPIFYYSALVPWTYFSVSLGFAGNSLVNNAGLIRKVYFPRAAIPAAAALSGLLDFAIAFVVLLGMMMYYNIPFGPGILLWPVLVIFLMMLVLGLGMILSSLNVKFRDVKYTIPFFTQTLLFITPIIYPASIIPERYRFLMTLNPLHGLLKAFRASLLPNRQIDWQAVLFSMVVIIVVFLVSIFYFKKTEREFADII